MRSVEETFELLVSAAAVNDAYAFERVLASHSSEFEPGALSAFLGLAPAIAALLNGYDYLRSPAFRLATAGKGEAFVQMKRKLESSPEHRAQRSKQLEAALCRLPSSRDAYDLLDLADHGVLDDAMSRIEAAREQV